MRKFFGIIGIALIFVISFGTFFGLARGTINSIAGFDFRTVNEANYIRVENYELTSTEDENAAIQVSIDEDGIITMKGKNEGNTALTYKVTTVSLEKGEYEFVSNTKGCSDTTYQVIMRNSNGNEVIADEKFTIEEADSYEVIIIIYGGASVDKNFAPVIVNEGEKTKFLVNNWNIFKK